MLQVLVIPLLFAAAPLPDDAVYLKARIRNAEIEVGQTYDISFQYGLKKGLNGGSAGMPNPILQIKAPASVTLTGDVLTTQKELSKNEFLQAPFERLVKGKKTKIGFTLDSEPQPGEEFSLTFIAYVRGRNEQFHFVRRRLTLSLAPKAKSAKAPPTPSNWGEVDTLQIGDKADPFELPKADGTKVVLTDYLGKKNIIVTTYRAHW